MFGVQNLVKRSADRRSADVLVLELQSFVERAAGMAEWLGCSSFIPVPIVLAPCPH